MEVQTVWSLHEYELNEQDMQGALKCKNVILNQTQTLEKQLEDVSIKDVSKPKPLKAEVISFSGQPKSEAFPPAPSSMSSSLVPYHCALGSLRALSRPLCHLPLAVLLASHLLLLLDANKILTVLDSKSCLALFCFTLTHPAQNSPS